MFRRTSLQIQLQIFKVFSFLLCFTAFQQSYSQVGVIDVGFNNGGKLLTRFNESDAKCNAVAVLPNGKILSAGYIDEVNSRVGVVARFNNNGTVDSTFGSSGKVTLNIGHVSDEIYAMAINPNGSILVTGSTSDSIFNPQLFTLATSMFVARFKPEGILDSAFGKSGVSLVPSYQGGEDEAKTIVITASNDIVIAGVITNVGGDDLGIARFNSAGKLDSSFGTNGIVVHDLNNKGEVIWKILESPGGKLLVCGDTNDSNISNGTDLFVARYLFNGQVDTTFGVNGFIITDLGVSEQALSMAFDAAGNFLVAGVRSDANTGHSELLVIKYKPDGSPDTTFGTSGIVLKDFQVNSEIVSAVGFTIAILPNGNITIAGTIKQDYNDLSYFALFGLQSNGDVDPLFGKNGMVYTELNGLPAFAVSTALQDDAKLIVGGYTFFVDSLTYELSTDFVLVRYELNKMLKYNSVYASVFIDKNLNGIEDANETLTRKATLIALNPVADAMFFESNNGIIMADVDTGKYTFLPFPVPYYNAVPAGIYTNHIDYFNTDTLRFALKPDPNKQDISIELFPLTAARPGFEVAYKALYENVGTTTISNGSVELIIDKKLNFKSSSPAYSTRVGDTLKWNYSNFQPTDTSGIVLHFDVAAPPVTNYGDTIRNQVDVFPVQQDLASGNNSFTLLQQVTGSYDPNDKSESHAGRLKIAQVNSGDYLQYTIRFQNTGTDTAFNVYLKDTLSDKLDWNTMEVMAASHPYQLSRRKGNQCTWIFSNIQLADSNRHEQASHGYVIYKLKPKATVVPGDTIKNTASIYFDYNLPVQTNTEKTTVESQALPLKLIQFSAMKKGDINQLTWTTTQQVNFDHFEVEVSTNGQLFNNLGSVVGSLATQFSFTHTNPAKAINYYRLKIIDKDGRFEYSNVKPVNNLAAFTATIYPNPVRDKLNLQFDVIEKTTLKLEIISMDGKVIQSTTVNANPNSSSLINVSALTKASYMLRLSSALDQIVINFQKQ